MTKVLSVTVKNLVGDSDYEYVEFTELNKLINEGWSISQKDIVNSNTGSIFTIIYRLDK